MKKTYIAPRVENQKIVPVTMIAASLGVAGTLTEETFGDAKGRGHNAEEDAWADDLW